LLDRLRNIPDDNPEVHSFLLDLLTGDYGLQERLRAPIDVVSDDRIIYDVVELQYERTHEFNTPPHPRYLRLFRDLIELRPHLIGRLLDVADDLAMKVAVASSRFVGDPAIRCRVTNTTDSFFTAKASIALPKQLGAVLFENPTISPNMRNMITGPSQDSRQRDIAKILYAQDHYDYEHVTGTRTLTVLVERAIGEKYPWGHDYKNFATTNEWDLLTLARNKNLTADLAYQLLGALSRSETLRRLGPSRAACARDLLTERFSHLWELPAPQVEPVARSWEHPTAETHPTIDPLELTMSQMLKTTAIDASAIATVLGPDHVAWATFLNLLSHVTEETTIAKAATTAARLVKSATAPALV
jgi:hypothetical protein